MDNKRYEELQDKISKLNAEINKLRDEQRELELEEIAKIGIKIDQESGPVVYMYVTDVCREDNEIFFNGEKFYYEKNPEYESYAMWGGNEQCYVNVDNIDDEVTVISKEEYETKFNDMVSMIKERHKTIQLDTVNGDCQHRRELQ